MAEESSKTATLRSIGEFSFINLVEARARAFYRDDVVVGIGDDTAVLHFNDREFLLLTCDGQIEDTHFLCQLTDPFSLGRRLVNVNASDIAAMGGKLRWAVIAVNVPPDTEVAWLEKFFDGLLWQLEQYGACLVGGNCSKATGKLVFDLTVAGTVLKDLLVTRKGAQPGDLLAVTGTLGRAKAGLEIIKAPHCFQDMPQDVIENLIAAYRVGGARVELGAKIASVGLARSMIDVSDGLLQDASHLCSDDLDVVIDAARVPVNPGCVMVAERSGEDGLWWGLAGGEDYELLFSVPPEKVNLLDSIHSATGVPVTVVGRFCEGKGRVLLEREGKIETVKQGGWQHF
ncbi:MAG: thiamine-phosphate kinase [Deltaproteobacteria bacterium]|nr:thiamine-phosphate kinase [Deltaproteobacteria bacterium]MBW2068318.1 thiamine-phosphate kinase [Deltaproteobacteria bacterium]